MRWLWPRQPGRSLHRGCHGQYTMSFSTGKSRPVVISDRPIGSLALSVSPDQRFILYSQSDQSGSDLMLIENFAVR